jgi:hypothetical protein
MTYKSSKASPLNLVVPVLADPNDRTLDGCTSDVGEDRRLGWAGGTTRRSRYPRRSSLWDLGWLAASGGMRAFLCMYLIGAYAEKGNVRVIAPDAQSHGNSHRKVPENRSGFLEKRTSWSSTAPRSSGRCRNIRRWLCFMTCISSRAQL